LSQLDTNFNTLANAVNGISDGSETLANVTATVVNATTVDTTNIEVTNIKAKDGTAAGSIADSTGVVTLASSVLTTTDINGGTIDGTVIGGASAAAGAFTTLNTSGAVVFNDAGADVDFRVEGDTNTHLLFVDAGNDRVGIGTSSPVAKLDIEVSAPAAVYNGICFVTSSAGGPNNGLLLGLRYSGSSTIRSSIGLVFQDLNATVNSYITFGTGGSNAERARIDASGNLLVGKTALNSNNVGWQLEAIGTGAITADGGSPLLLNRKTSNGDLLIFRKDGTTVGSIGYDASGLYIDGESNHSGIQFAGDTWLPRDNGVTVDNLIDLGTITLRFDDIYATNGTIQTSDRNEKQDIEELSEAETRVAVAAKALMRKYRWKSAVEEKGDDARIHFGIIAQDLKAAFETEGLDAGRYAMFIHSAWWEKERIIPAVEGKEAVYETQTDEEGNETQVLVSEAVEAQPEKTVIDTFETEEEAGEGAVRKERMGIRYNELLAFIIAAI
jgi:hypothetical protein